MTSVDENAYQVLGLETGPDTTEKEIKKAYRKLALIKHPDKNPDNPNAAAEFNAIQRAYDLLLDPEARSALDNLLRAKALRVERFAIHNEKRRKMAQDLERREKAAEQGVSEEEIARIKLQKEIERLRKAAAAKREAAQPQPQSNDNNNNYTTTTFDTSIPLDERLQRTIKATWLRHERDEYDSVELREIFSEYGVEDIVVREGKKKKKEGSALIVLGSVHAAHAAASNVHGRAENPLLVVLLQKGSGETHKEGEKGKEMQDKPILDTNNTMGDTMGTATASKSIDAPSLLPVVSSLGARPIKPLFAGAASLHAPSSMGFVGRKSPMKPLFAAARNDQNDSDDNDE